MSYTIEYNHQFLRSERGITPVWLSGDNNVWEPRPYGRERRSRSWSCFCRLLGASKNAIRAHIESMCDGGEWQQHWVGRDGKWLNDDAIRRWARFGIQRACTVEQITGLNKWPSLSAYLSVWSKSLENTIELHQKIYTTEDLDKWIDRVKEREKNTMQGESIYPIIVFPEEEFRKPTLLERKHPKAGNVALQVVNGPHAGDYIHKVTKTSYWVTPTLHAAYLYCGEEAARRAAARLCRRHASLELEPYTVSSEIVEKLNQEEPA